MGLTKKAEKWAYAVGFPRDPSAWEYADAAPFKEFIAKLLSAELTKNTPDLVASEPIPFEKLLLIAQHKLGIHSCLVGADLAGDGNKLKLGLFGTIINIKSALKDFKSDVIAQIPSPDFGIAGGQYSSQSKCNKCKKEVLFIERIVVGENVWHRRCMHCHLCGKRLFLGMFRYCEGKLECIEHLLNKELIGNQLLSFENTNVAKPPPPRPPPPRLSVASAASPTPSPEPRRASVAVVTSPSQLNTPKRNSKMPSPGPISPDQENNWEVVEYPEQLNPFADEDDALSDCLNPFGYTSSEDEESDSEVPVPVPRKSIQSAMAEAIEDIDYSKPKVVQDESDNENKVPVENVKKEEPKEEPKKEELKEEVVIKQEENVYPDLKKVTLNPYTDSLLDLYLPSSLSLCKKRKIETSEMDRPKLLHELAKVIKTLDYIERHSTEFEVELLKEFKKEGFKWEKSASVDSWAVAMQQKHDNLLKGSMIVHEYLSKLIEAALAKIKQLSSTGVDKSNLKDQLLELKNLLNKSTLLPIVLTTPTETALAIPHKVKAQKSPKTPKDEKEKVKKSLVNRIKKVF